MLQKRLRDEVAVPLYVAGKNLFSILTSEEMIYAYIGTFITLVVFLVDGYDELVNAARWSIGCLVDLGEPEVSEVFVDENLYLMASHDSWEILGADVMEVVAWWQGKASQVLNEVIDVDFWKEDSPLLLRAAPTLLCLPAAGGVQRPKPRKIKK